jgi:hypothetical protein
MFGHGDKDFGLIRADDQYGMMRADMLRKVPAQGSYYHSDRTQMTEIVLHGPFYQVPEWLYFRREHPDRPKNATPTVRGWCANQDPRRADKLRHPTVRLLTEFVWGYVAAINRAPLSAADRLRCYGILTEWLGNRTAPVFKRIAGGNMFAGEQAEIPPVPEWLSVETLVAGRERKPS